MSRDPAKQTLWFTSTESSELLGGHAAFAGLYECQLKGDGFDCVKPELLVDKWDTNGTHRRGVDLTDVVIDESNHLFYTEYFDGERMSWEILRASYGSRPILLESFFRTDQRNGNNNCMMKCCKNGGHTYFMVEPRSYIVEGNEVFISWDGFYQDCSDGFASKRDLQWSMGVSRIIQSPACVLTDGLNPVRFENCTSPVSIVYQGGHGAARQTLLGYSGMASSLSPSGKRIFYLSVLRDAGEMAYNEIWTVPESENYSKNPLAVQKFGTIPVSKKFLEHPVDDVGTIRLRLNDDGIPTAACRTAYDAGVYCYALEMNNESIINVIEQKEFVNREQLLESCTVESSHYPITKILPPVSTGLEVFWREDSPDEAPEMLFFGCYGEIDGLGNFTTAFGNGTMKRTIHGGHPGTILFGPEVAPSPEPRGDYIAPGLELPGYDASRKFPGVFPFIGLLALTTIVLFVGSRIQGKREARHQHYLLVHDEFDAPSPPENRSSISYVELV